ncbi:MAG TPA: hypothetical protein VKR32_01850 [Puia sp.]|nr:hypothetical protein [Puia sp.]
MQKIVTCLLFFISFAQASVSQVAISGTVFDRTQQFPLEAVSVLSVSGRGTVTDSLGHYAILLNSNDSIYFSYLGKRSPEFAVSEISEPFHFEISLDINVDTLRSISVNHRNYKLDSLETRAEYQKVFDYSGPGYLDNMKTTRRGGIGMAFDFDLILNAKNSKRILALQQRLERDEKDNYVAHRFNAEIVGKITGLLPPAIDTFMKEYRPTYQFLKSFTTDWDFYEYLKDAGKRFLDVWKERHPNYPN